MKAHNTMPFRTALPSPAFVLRPITAAVIAAVHVYLAAGHLSRLIGGEVEWTHIWKVAERWPVRTCSPRSHRAGLLNTKFSLDWSHNGKRNRIACRRSV